MKTNLLQPKPKPIQNLLTQNSLTQDPRTQNLNPEPPNPEPVGEDDILSKEDVYKIMEDFKNESVN